MDRELFNKLRVGDICTVKRGRDKDKICTVLYIKNESILVEAEDGTFFDAIGCNKKLRLTHYHEIDNLKD